MSFETGWDEWQNQDLILDERISGSQRWIKNFVEGGFILNDGGGLNVIVGLPALNVAYINGYEIKQNGTVVRSLTPSAQNFVFLHFVKTPDPIQGTIAITVFVTVNTSGIPPLNSLLLGHVDTNLVGVTGIQQNNNSFKLQGQFDSDIEGNRRRIDRLVLDGGLVLIAAVAIIPGQFVRISGINQVSLAIADDESRSEAIGASDDSGSGLSPIFIRTAYGQRMSLVQFETGLTLVEGTRVFLSPTVAGALTNIPPGVGEINKPLGILVDASAYVGGVSSDSLADIVFRPEITTRVM